MPPPPRVEPKLAAVPASVINIGNDRDYVPLTDLITPRVSEHPTTATGKGKGRMPKSDDDLPISDDPSAEEITRAEDTRNEVEAFGMNDLSLGLDLDTSLVGYSGDAGRKAANKFIK
jgi:hypothetical protein